MKGDVTRATHHQHMCIIHTANFCPNRLHIYSRINVIHILRVSKKIFQINDCFHIQCITNTSEGIFDVSRIIQINTFLKLSLDASFRKEKKTGLNCTDSVVWKTPKKAHLPAQKLFL